MILFRMGGNIMSENVSYTPEEVANILKISRFTVYEMIKRGELQAYRIGRKMRIEANDLEAYKQRGKGLQQVGKVETKPFVPSIQSGEGFIVCGQDIALDILTRHLGRINPNQPVLRNHVGSFDGLLSLYHGKANVATAHLWASDVDEYNIPYVRRLLPGVNAVVINLAYRMAGLYVHASNPHEIATWSDLSKSGIRFINREKGSGARVLLDEQLKRHKIGYRKITGYDTEETSHMAIASAIARGDADAGVGIEKVAMQVKDIIFIPLQREQYDIIIRKEDLEQANFQELLAVLRSQAFKNEVLGMGHYDVSRMGEIVAEV